MPRIVTRGTHGGGLNQEVQGPGPKKVADAPIQPVVSRTNHGRPIDPSNTPGKGGCLNIMLLFGGAIIGFIISLL